MNVALTGFMGAGKTTTGRWLGRLLQMPFVDTDAEIIARHGAISVIFEKQGESAFRAYEATVIAELARSGPSVIAVGGGAVLPAENRRRLRSTGFIVHLSVSPQTVYRRVVRRAHRPLLGSTPDFATICRLLEDRAQAYADCDLAINVDRKSPRTAAKFIARWYADRMREFVHAAE